MLILRHWLPCLAALSICFTPAAAAPSAPITASPASASPLQNVDDIDEDPAQVQFRWSQNVQDLGEASVPTPGQAGWALGPNGIYYRGVPSFSGDPTFELILRAPYSGNALYPERLLVQIPANFSTKSFLDRAVVVAFHKFSVSEKDIFLNTTLPQECRQRGWMLVAPYGLTDTNFGNAQSQASFATVANALFAVVPFNYRRVYGVGFSMGGISALSYGMRHLDDFQLQFAAVAIHTASLDMQQVYNNSGLAVQLVLSNSRHFGGTPSQNPFEYQRVSPVQFLSSGLVDVSSTPVVNFESRPIYLHSNLADPKTTLVAGMSSLSQFLQQRGANVVEDLVYEPTLGHSWSTMDMRKALDFLGQQTLPQAHPASQDFVVDNPGRWLQVEVDSLEPDRFAKFHFELAPFQLGVLNSFALTGTEDLVEITMPLNKLGLSGSQVLQFTHSTTDGTYDWITLTDVPTKPKSIKANGGPPATWHYNPTLERLRIVPSISGAAVTVVITP